MNIAELLYLSESHRPQDSIRNYLLDEAYLGKNPVSKIELAMSKIVDAISADPDKMIQGTQYAKDLEKAIKDVFGFKRVNVTWSYRPGGGIGPYTMVSSIIWHSGSSSFTYGTNKSGFYDKDHELTVYIQMDQALVTTFHMSAAEMTGILLHEIGHNFDYSCWSIYNAWYTLLVQLLSGDILSILNVPIQEWGRPVYQAVLNIDTYIQSSIPPIGTVLRAVGKVSFNISRFLQGLFSPLTVLFTLPIMALYAPLNYIQNFFTRKKERFADSFAASYGYGKETISALEKFESVRTGNPEAGPVMQFFYDIARFQQESISLFLGGHGSNQQRMIKIIDKLQKDLNDKQLSPAMKAELLEILNQTKSDYDKMINLDEENKNKLTGIFRRLVDNWYDGKSHMIIPSFGYEYAE